MIATHEPGLNGPLVAGVDIGGTNTSVVVTDNRDRILYGQPGHHPPRRRIGLPGREGVGER